MRCFALWERWELQLLPENFSGNPGLDNPYPSPWRPASLKYPLLYCRTRNYRLTPIISLPGPLLYYRFIYLQCPTISGRFVAPTTSQMYSRKPSSLDSQILTLLGCSVAPSPIPIFSKICNNIHHFRLFCRISCNSFTITNAELNTVGIGIYQTASLLNHSCDPNCVALFDGRDITIRAIKPIPSGKR